MEPWERDIFLTVRDESFYFYPVFACQIINEGWASQWHARLLREADFLDDQLYLDAIKTHSDVVRPHAGDNQVALSINSYHLSFMIWQQIIDEQGMEAARHIRRDEDDFAFLRNHLSQELASELGLFRFNAQQDGEVEVQESDIDALCDALLASKYNFAAPHIRVETMASDGSLTLLHDHRTDAIGLNIERAEKVLHYLHRVWRRPLQLITLNSAGKQTELAA